MSRIGRGSRSLRLDDDYDDDYGYAPGRSRRRYERADSRRRSRDERPIGDDRRGDQDRGAFENRGNEISYTDRQVKEKDMHSQIKSMWLNPAEEDDKKPGKKERSIVGKARVDVMQVAVGAQMMSKHKAFVEKSPLVISPRTWYMRKWDLVTLILLLFTAVVTPVEVAFLETRLWSILFWVNRSVDALFVFDIFLNFFVAIVDPLDGQLVFHHPTIIKKYLKGWFIIDVISVMPFDLLSFIFENGEVGKLKILRVLRLLRLMKLLRILRAGRIFQRLETQYQIDYSRLELAKFVLLALLTSHWMACAFGIVADLEDSDYNWMYYTAFNKYTENGLLTEGMDPRGVVSDTDIYFAAFYWSSMTMTTIGYGDVVPSTLIERIFCSIMMLVGAFAYGYIIGAVGNVITQANEKKNKFYALMGELNSFLDEGRLNRALRIRLREYFKYKMGSTNVSAHNALLREMSPALRAEITLSINTWITKVGFFKKCPEAFVIQLTLSIKQQTFPPQEKVIVPGDWCDSMFIVRKGVAICRKKIITTGQVFCVESLYKEGKVAYSAHAVTFCDLYTLKRDVLLATLKHFPEMLSHFKLLSLRRLFFDEVMAYTKAYRTLEKDGKYAVLASPMDERPAFYLEKLRIEYGEDGEGMGEAGAKIQRIKTRAAVTLQRLFRGHRSRREVNVVAAETGIYPVFPAQLRQNDPTAYSARAVDLLHHRVGSSLFALHEKVDRLLGTQRDPVPKWFADQGKSGLQFCTAFDSTGKRFERPTAAVSSTSLKKGVSLGSVNFGSPAPSLSAQRSVGGAIVERRNESERLRAQTSLALRSATAASFSGRTPTAFEKDAELRELRAELREALAVVRGGAVTTRAPDVGGFATPGPDAGDGSLAARTTQLQSLVGDLAQQVHAVSRTISGMSDAQRTFQERSQRTILGHLEQAQARIADQVARAVAAAGGDSARLSTGTRPSAMASGGGLGITESDPPPRYGGRPPNGGGTYDRDRDERPRYGRQPSPQRRPLSGGPPPWDRRS